MSAALQLPNPQEDASSVLALLTDMVRQGTRGALEALAQQLRPILISLAVTLQPEDPHDLLTALYQAVLRGKRTLIQLQSDIFTIYRTTWRSQKRERVGVAHLQLVQEAEEDVLDDGQKVIPGEVSILLKYLSDEDRLLWIGMSEEKTLAQLAGELGWSYETTKKRWQELTERVKATLETEPI